MGTSCFFLDEGSGALTLESWVLKPDGHGCLDGGNSKLDGPSGNPESAGFRISSEMSRVPCFVQQLVDGIQLPIILTQCGPIMCQELLHMLPYLSVIAALWYYSPCSADEETEAQRG